ncbi:hypothetical protein [Halobellus limi]|uniref:Uncharacterized protein n=1 Tax=Halobellus limi TaxID=699433 RepID=A0A1H5YG22_9EURY|nr:hypothetical protein [Halobellus limi]QCC48465.1 hypothetical protein DV707_12765 [Halobellus limi]SEG22998.1 hypothetical protein SAMN04488133_1578 [Halobellus limi]
MRVLGVIRRRTAAILRCRLCFPAVVALAIATAGIAYGVTNDDIVTALGASLFVPSAAILFGIASRRRGGLFDRVPRRPS